MRKIVLRKAFALFLAFSFASPIFAAADLKPEEIIAKHAQSLGKPGVLSGLSTLMGGGAAEFISLSPTIKGGGKAVVVSDEKKPLLCHQTEL